MDVELQILKHLPRDAQPTVAIIDKYCAEENPINLFTSLNKPLSKHCSTSVGGCLCLAAM